MLYYGKIFQFSVWGYAANVMIELNLYWSKNIPLMAIFHVSVKAKYTYVPLNMLKHKTVVNVYGVVTFFKLPFPSKGSGQWISFIPARL